MLHEDSEHRATKLFAGMEAYSEVSIISSVFLGTTTVTPSDSPQATGEYQGIRAGTWAFFRVQIALFFGGFATFSMLYGVQPLLLLFSQAYDITPAHASIALSTATGVMSVMLVGMSLISDRFGRRIVLLSSLFAATALMLGCSLTDNFSQLIVLRTLQGFALAGPPAVAMAYLSEEVDYSALAYAMGFYISGNAMGGMCGRFFCAFVAEHYSWAIALGALSVLALLMSLACWWLLPPSRRFKPRSMKLSVMWAGMRGHLCDARMPWLFVIAFLSMGCFVSVFNFVQYRLHDSPFNLSVGQIGSIFLLYVIGMFSSTWVGRLADRFGMSRVLWVVITLLLAGTLITISYNLWVVIFGMAMLTFGFFGCHTVASSWVGRRAKEARGLASALYLWAYYFGSSVIGTLSGTLWGVGGWQAIVGCLTVCLVAALAIAVYLHRREMDLERG